ncbi:hypothetical protein POM88_052403 [Heracleum sosnowskyi]|uniref:BHLH domain-containing protein n=1 Tax=Heracleum sosnowskyi TaxID=360622 RepID=A0AAD8LYM5_9APIA|nr:hypothetical protein POM88_052403 [Heracleum sosnowskyi]
MNESYRGDDRIKEEALRDIGKDLILGQPQVENETTAWCIHQLNPKNPTHVDQDLLLNRLDSIPPLANPLVSDISHRETNDRKRKGIENQGECQNTELHQSHETRRSKITEKFQKLQELLSQGSNTASQASTQDGALTYIKSTTELLQMLAKMSPVNAKAIEQYYPRKFA